MFVRNDNDPIRATIAVIGGGIVNAILDPILVFKFNLGIYGAGMATLTGQIVSFIILATHFISKKNQLKIVKTSNLIIDIKSIIIVGFSSFVLDICMGIVTIVFNNQIAKYNTDNYAKAYLAIYGVIINMHTLIQSFGYAIGQASQPLLSESKGSNNNKLLKFKLESI